jgi:hypothetical protein
MKLLACSLSGIYSESEAFQKSLQKLSYSRGGKGHRSSMQSMQSDGLSFVTKYAVIPVEQLMRKLYNSLYNFTVSGWKVQLIERVLTHTSVNKSTDIIERENGDTEDEFLDDEKRMKSPGSKTEAILKTRVKSIQNMDTSSRASKFCSYLTKRSAK